MTTTWSGVKHGLGELGGQLNTGGRMVIVFVFFGVGWGARGLKT